MTQPTFSTPPSAPPEKAKLRAAVLRARAEIADDVRVAAAQAVAVEGARLVAAAKPGRVSLFFSVRGEIDVLPLAHALDAAGVKLCLPVIVAKGRPLAFRDWRPGDRLEPRPFGLSEPPATAPEVTPDLLFAPLAAFDDRGFRLGYGGGFYDRTLAKLRAEGGKPVAIGLAFASQRIDSVPTDPWDEPLDGVLTDSGYRATSGASA